MLYFIIKFLFLNFIRFRVNINHCQVVDGLAYIYFPIIPQNLLGHFIDFIIDCTNSTSNPFLNEMVNETYFLHIISTTHTTWIWICWRCNPELRISRQVVCSHWFKMISGSTVMNPDASLGTLFIKKQKN